MEFRVTSRSPRSPREAPKLSTVDQAEKNLHQTIHDHATGYEDWYRVKRDANKQQIYETDDWQGEIEDEEEDFDDADLLDLN